MTKQIDPYSTIDAIDTGTSTNTSANTAYASHHELEARLTPAQTGETPSKQRREATRRAWG